MFSPLRENPMSDFSIKRLSSSGDPIADVVALRIDRRRPAQMMDEVHYLAKTEISIYQEFVDQLNTLPTWLDWDQIEHARRLQAAFNHARSIAILPTSALGGDNCKLVQLPHLRKCSLYINVGWIPIHVTV